MRRTDTQQMNREATSTHVNSGEQSFPQRINNTCCLPPQTCKTIRLGKFWGFWLRTFCFLQKTRGLGAKLKLRQTGEANLLATGLNNTRQGSLLYTGRNKTCLWATELRLLLGLSPAYWVTWADHTRVIQFLL